MRRQCEDNLCTMYMQCVDNVHTIGIQCVDNVHTMRRQCAYNWHYTTTLHRARVTVEYENNESGNSRKGVIK